MKTFYLFLLILSLLSSSSLVLAEEAPFPENQDKEMILPDEDVLKPLVDTIQPVFKKLSIVVGGIFGLYVILILIRVYYERKKLKVLQDIRFDLDQLNKHYHLTSSRTRKTLIQQLIGYIHRVKANLRKK